MNADSANREPPAVLFYVAAYLARQGARLAVEMRTARGLAKDLMTPAALAATGTGDIMAVVRRLAR